MTKIHLTQPEYRGQAGCPAGLNGQQQVTEDVMEVTCRACLKQIAPERTLEELRESVRRVLEVRQPKS